MLNVGEHPMGGARWMNNYENVISQHIEHERVSGEHNKEADFSDLLGDEAKSNDRSVIPMISMKQMRKTKAMLQARRAALSAPENAPMQGENIQAGDGMNMQMAEAYQSGALPHESLFSSYPGGEEM